MPVDLTKRPRTIRVTPSPQMRAAVAVAANMPIPADVAAELGLPTLPDGRVDKAAVAALLAAQESA